MSSLRLKVWEAISTFAQITPIQARELCHDFIEANLLGEEVHVDDFVDESTSHQDFVEYMHNICVNSADFGIDLYFDMTSPVADPFYYSRKVSLKDVSTYMEAVKDSSYYCTICSDNYNDAEGMRLSCSNKNNCCTFCRVCIVPWITENVAKCPNCMEYLKPI
jgi:hypothetical protein